MSDGLTFELRLDADDILADERSDPTGSTEDGRKDNGGGRWLGVSINDESEPDTGLDEFDVRQDVLVR